MKGSKYAIIKLVESSKFLSIMNELIENTGANLTIFDNWMPKSLQLDKEAELKDFLKHNFSPQLSNDIIKWWLHKDTTTPNWDLVSTCTIDGKKGLILIEAKAHCDELNNESHGKKLKSGASIDSEKNHESIKKAIEDAKIGIEKAGFDTSISRDKCYQLSNRIAYSWWLANQGVPVVLVYLGFLKCADMNDGKNKLFQTDKDWQDCFLNHSKQVGIDCIINKRVNCGNSEFIAICRSINSDDF